MTGASIQWPNDQGPGYHTVALDPARGSLLIGRGTTASIAVPRDGTMSRAHAELHFVDGYWLIQDVESTSGTFIMRAGRTRRTDGRERLRHGDRIKAGRTILTFHDPPPPQGDIKTEVAAEDTIVLTPRERQILELLCENELAGRRGWPDKRELAATLFIAESTVKTHLNHLYGHFRLSAVHDNQKCAVLIRRAIDEGWVLPNPPETDGGQPPRR